MATGLMPSRLKRAQQWLKFARQWHVIDASGQDLWKLARKMAVYLAGKHKPIYHPETDCGDHVVTVNCTDVSMHSFDWKHSLFYFNRGYPRSKIELSAHQIHEFDPCRVVWMAASRELVDVTRCPTSNRIVQRRCLHRLHLFPNDDIPDFIRKNIGNQLEQVQEVPRKSTEYTEKDRQNFPRIFSIPQDHVLDWNDSSEPPEWYPNKAHPDPVEKIRNDIHKKN